MLEVIRSMFNTLLRNVKFDYVGPRARDAFNAGHCLLPTMSCPLLSYKFTH